MCITPNTTRGNCNTWLRRLLFTAIAAMTLCVVCRAQNNPYKIKDELYRMYTDAYRDRTTVKGLQMSTKLYNRAVALGDRRAQCIALTLPVSYFY